MAAAMMGCVEQPIPKAAIGNPPSTTPPVDKASPVPTEWPFEAPRDLAVISLTRIMNGTKPILYVVHDEDGDWQFLDGDDVSEEDAATVSLESVYKIDPTLKGIADLPPGWGAERDSNTKPWERFER
jgi:hypothetical protein